MLNVNLGHTPLRLMDSIRNSCHSYHSCSKTPTPGRLYTIRTSDCKITKSPLNGWDKKQEVMLNALINVELPNGLNGVCPNSTFNIQYSTFFLSPSLDKKALPLPKI